MNETQSRRKALKTLALGLGSATLLPAMNLGKSENIVEMLSSNPPMLKGNIKHSVCRWTYNDIPLDELCGLVQTLGFNAIDLVGPQEWDILQSAGVYCSMCNGAEISLTEGWNDPNFHEQLIANYERVIPEVGKAGYKNLICFSGNRNGMEDMVGLKNCAEGLNRILPLAEKFGVVICMELFNSKVDHKDYMCDKSAWGVELCKLLNSPNFKLLYDIYHMQINEGDIIHTIRENHQYFAHYHTAGVPGRHEIDETQELNYPAIMRAIHETGFEGYVAQEFIPTAEDKIGSLRKAIEICDI